MIIRAPRRRHLRAAPSSSRALHLPAAPILYYTILYYTLLYYTILYCIVLYCTIL